MVHILLGCRGRARPGAARQLLAYVDLYQVLGGGWSLRDEEWIAGTELPEDGAEDGAEHREGAEVADSPSSP